LEVSGWCASTSSKGYGKIKRARKFTREDKDFGDSLKKLLTETKKSRPLAHEEMQVMKQELGRDLERREIMEMIEEMRKLYPRYFPGR
jgi:hypothetical protein